jgi:hypothetical protein
VVGHVLRAVIVPHSKAACDGLREPAEVLNSIRLTQAVLQGVPINCEGEWRLTIRSGCPGCWRGMNLPGIRESRLSGLGGCENRSDMARKIENALSKHRCPEMRRVFQ